MGREFLGDRGNLMEKICECSTYGAVDDVLKLYLAERTMEQLNSKINVEVIDEHLYVIEGGKKRKIISATKEMLKELNSSSSEKGKEE